MNVEINEDYLKITTLKRFKNKISICESIHNDLDFKLEGKDEVCINGYSNKIAQAIKYELGKLRKSYKNINFNIQNEDIINRNIDVLNIKKKKDITKLIEFEITQHIPIDINEYLIKYKIVDSNQETIKTQVILFPKYLIKILKEVSKILNLRPKEININFDILQKFISLNLIDNFETDGTFIECKQRKFIVNIVKDKQIYESHILSRTVQSYESICKSIKKSTNVYYYGYKDPFIYEYLKEDFNLQCLKIKNNIKITKNEKEIKEESIKYINSIGMII
ncbi:pilus assembly protein PilM [[Clostridium] dakarense]|uniref:pilus assembly protein PilM n=1 Tax=Faecalimicrobium dakarense TaxID=1301100 RepID=UPI0012B65960|nr:pilus assembly protein PilM [[Clostridium] dakarense]